MDSLPIPEKYEIAPSAYHFYYYVNWIMPPLLVLAWLIFLKLKVARLE